MHDLLLRALKSEPLERPPVWLMRQAGRYMPEYRKLRERYSLETLFHTPDLSSEVTLQPVEILGVDAAILFSDILVIAEVFGLTLSFPDKGGPRIEPALKTAADVDALTPQKDLSYVFTAIRQLKTQLQVPLIGFAGGPFTVASYMIEKGKALSWIQEDPTSFHRLLALLTEVTISYLKEQIYAGVDLVQVFDSWANLLDEAQFHTFSLPYLQQIVQAIQPLAPVILFCRNSSLRHESLSSIAPSALSFDWHLPMHTLRKLVPSSIAIQGNFPPEFLHSTPDHIQQGVEELLRSMKGQRGWIVNLGHGVTPDTPVDHVRHFVACIQNNV